VAGAQAVADASLAAEEPGQVSLRRCAAFGGTARHCAKKTTDASGLCTLHRALPPPQHSAAGGAATADAGSAARAAAAAAELDGALADSCAHMRWLAAALAESGLVCVWPEVQQLVVQQQGALAAQLVKLSKAGKHDAGAPKLGPAAAAALQASYGWPAEGRLPPALEAALLQEVGSALERCSLSADGSWAVPAGCAPALAGAGTGDLLLRQVRGTLTAL
jgi:hypothetical protein